MRILEIGTIEEVWEEIEWKLSSNREPYSTMKGIYEIQISDKDVKYQLSFTDGEYSITRDSTGSPDCILEMKNVVFRKFLAGKLNSMTAFMTGKLKVNGNITLALKLENMLKQYQF